MSCQQWHKDNSKKTRFRFAESERIKALKELFNVLCEDTPTTEEQLWENLHSILCYDSDRFKSCSVRLLKDHMLEQVAKYRKYDSEEATESGKERLKTEWGDTMRLLLTVWCNYEQIVRQEAEKKSCKGGRPKKVISQEKNEIAAAKAIREAALQPLEEEYRESPYNSEESVDLLLDEVEIHQIDEPSTQSPSLIEEHSYVRTPVNLNKRHHTQNAIKTRGRTNTEIFKFLSEKQRAEEREKENDLTFKKQQHADNMRLQEEELAYKKAKLNFEERQWREQEEDRQIERNRNKMINSLLEKVLLANVSKNI